MSDKCRTRFLQELCLYECDPYLATWIVKDTSKKIRNERFFGIPLCKQDCYAWFDDCRYDYTCAKNWNNEFKWLKTENGSKNVCMDYAKCDTFENVFGCAENFCQSIWDGSFRVPNNDSEPCISFNFNGDNPNARVESYYESLINESNSLKFQIKFSLILLFLICYFN
jgi:folate receptor